ncbi:MAG TPA: hypothetical protein VKV19_00120 [Ktedonobacteraceae bacterium]|nr:hypothetical protein [Ktedonobacteraceae bacterium]
MKRAESGSVLEPDTAYVGQFLATRSSSWVETVFHARPIKSMHMYLYSAIIAAALPLLNNREAPDGPGAMGVSAG